MKFRATLYDFDDTSKQWTIDLDASGPRAARHWLNKYAGEYNFGIWTNPEEISGECDMPVIKRPLAS